MISTTPAIEASALRVDIASYERAVMLMICHYVAYDMALPAPYAIRRTLIRHYYRFSPLRYAMPLRCRHADAADYAAATSPRFRRAMMPLMLP